MRGFHHLLAACLFLPWAGPALADDWYEFAPGNTQCQDITALSDAAGNPDLGTPDGTAALYQALGETVLTHQVRDASGAAIIVMRITDSTGNLMLNTTFYPSLADCQFVLAYEKAK